MDQATRDFISERFEVAMAKMRARMSTPEGRAREEQRIRQELNQIKRSAGAYIEEIMVGQAQAYQRIKHQRYIG